MPTNSICLTEKFPHLKEIGIMDFRCDSSKDYRTALSKHHHGQNYEIGYIKTGVFSQMFFSPSDEAPESAQVCELHGEELVINTPYSVHSTAPDIPFHALAYWIVLNPDCPRFLNLSPESAALLKETLHRAKQNILHIPQSISAHLLDAFHLLTNPTEINVFRACNLLSLFIVELMEFETGYADQLSKYNDLSPAAVDAVMFINNNLLNPDLNLDTIAKHLQYSRTYTSTFIKQELGMTLRDFITLSKIKHACKLLQNHSVTETAMLLNFSSSQYFSNVFKKQMNMTPSAYRIRCCKDPKQMPHTFQTI